MLEIVAEQFQPDRIPQSFPRSAQYPVYELAPHLRKHCLYSLTHTADEFSFGRRINSRQHQQFAFRGKHLTKFRPAITQISQKDSSINRFAQFNSRISIIPVSRTEKSIYYQPRCIAQQVQLETKEPSSRTFAEASAIIAQQAHTAGTNGVTNRY